MNCIRCSVEPCLLNFIPYCVELHIAIMSKSGKGKLAAGTKAVLKYAIGLGSRPGKLDGHRSRSLEDPLRRPELDEDSVFPLPPPPVGPVSPTQSERGDRSEMSEDESHPPPRDRAVPKPSSAEALSTSLVKTSPRVPAAASFSREVEIPVTVHKNKSDRTSRLSNDSEAYLTVEEWNAESSQRDKRRRFPKPQRKYDSKTEVERELEREERKQRAQVRESSRRYDDSESGSSDEEDLYGTPHRATTKTTSERTIKHTHYEPERREYASQSRRSDSKEPRHHKHFSDRSREVSRERRSERRKVDRQISYHSSSDEEYYEDKQRAEKNRAYSKPKTDNTHRKRYGYNSDTRQQDYGENSKESRRGRQLSGSDSEHNRRDEVHYRRRRDRDVESRKGTNRQFSYEESEEEERRREAGRGWSSPQRYNRQNSESNGRKSRETFWKCSDDERSHSRPRERFNNDRQGERYARQVSAREQSVRRRSRDRTPSPVVRRRRGDNSSERWREDRYSRRRSISPDHRRTSRTERTRSPAEKQGKTNKSETNVISLTHKLPELTVWTNAPADKQTFTEFLDSFTLQCHALMISKNNWSRILPLYLQDGSMVVYRQIIEKHPDFADDYDALVKALSQEFQACGNVVSAVDLYGRKKQSSESIGKFYSSICSMAKRLYPDMTDKARDQIILGAFTQGLPANYQRHLLNSPTIKTCEDAFKLSQRLERTNALLQKDSNTSAVNQISETPQALQGAVETMQRSLKQLEAREREREEQEDRQARHQWRENNLSRPPIGPNRSRYNYQPPSRGRGRNERNPGRQNWRQTDDWRQQNQQRSNYGSRGDNFHQNRGQGNYGYNSCNNNYRNQRSWQYNTRGSSPMNQQRRNFNGPSQQQQSDNFRNSERQNFGQTRKYVDRFERAVDYNNRHTGQEFTTDGRPRCSRCGQTGHLHFMCPTMRDNNQSPAATMYASEQPDRRVRFYDPNNNSPSRQNHTDNKQNWRDQTYNSRVPVYTLYQHEAKSNTCTTRAVQTDISGSDAEQPYSSEDDFNVDDFLESYLETTATTQMSTAEPHKGKPNRIANVQNSAEDIGYTQGISINHEYQRTSIIDKCPAKERTSDLQSVQLNSLDDEVETEEFFDCNTEGPGTPNPIASASTINMLQKEPVNKSDKIEQRLTRSEESIQTSMLLGSGRNVEVLTEKEDNSLNPHTSWLSPRVETTNKQTPQIHVHSKGDVICCLGKDRQMRELKKKVNWIGQLKVVILIRILTAAVIAFHSPTASDKATNKSKEEMNAVGRPMIALENSGDTTPKIGVEHTLLFQTGNAYAIPAFKMHLKTGQSNCQTDKYKLDGSDVASVQRYDKDDEWDLIWYLGSREIQGNYSVSDREEMSSHSPDDLSEIKHQKVITIQSEHPWNPGPTGDSEWNTLAAGKPENVSIKDIDHVTGNCNTEELIFSIAKQKHLTPHSTSGRTTGMLNYAISILELYI